MKKLESSLRNMLLVLTGITVFCAALLAVVNELTREPIEQAKLNALNDALKEVLPDFDEIHPDTIFTQDNNGEKQVSSIVYPAKQNGKWVGSAVQITTSKGFGGDISILVGFSANGEILNYSILASSETPGLGSKADRWFGGYKKADGIAPVLHSEKSSGSIIGMNPGEAALRVHKDCEAGYSGRVDGITASTITSRAFLNAVNDAYTTFTGQIPDGTTGASRQDTHKDLNQ